MKNLFTITFVLLSLQAIAQIGNNPSDFKNGIKTITPAANSSDEVIAVSGTGLVVNTGVTLAQLNTAILGGSDFTLSPIVENKFTIRRDGVDIIASEIDLTPYLDNEQVVSGTVDNTTGMLTLTNSDASTFTIDLSSLLNIQNASQVSIEDVGGNFIATDVEGALTEIAIGLSNSGDVSTVGTPSNGKVAVWTGDGTLGFNDNFLYTASNNSVFLFDPSGDRTVLEPGKVSIRTNGTNVVRSSLGLGSLVLGNIGADGQSYLDATELEFRSTNSGRVNLSPANNNWGTSDYDLILPFESGTLVTTNSLAGFAELNSTNTFTQQNNFANVFANQFLAADRLFVEPKPLSTSPGFVGAISNLGSHNAITFLPDNIFVLGKYEENFNFLSLDYDGITDERTLIAPDASGTIALTSDINNYFSFKDVFTGLPNSSSTNAAFREGVLGLNEPNPVEQLDVVGSMKQEYTYANGAVVRNQFGGENLASEVGFPSSGIKGIYQTLAASTGSTEELDGMIAQNALVDLSGIGSVDLLAYHGIQNVTGSRAAKLQSGQGLTNTNGYFTGVETISTNSDRSWFRLYDLGFGVGNDLEPMMNLRIEGGNSLMTSTATPHEFSTNANIFRLDDYGQGNRGSGYVNTDDVANTGTAPTVLGDATSLAAWDINGNFVEVLVDSTPPATSSSVGTKGQIIIDGLHIYICVNTNSWVRTPLTTW